MDDGVLDCEMYEAERAARWQAGMTGGRGVVGARAFGLGRRRAWWQSLTSAEQAQEVMADAARVRAHRDQEAAIARSRAERRWCVCRTTAPGSLCSSCGWWKALIP
jgi:hypothetical protein